MSFWTKVKTNVKLNYKYTLKKKLYAMNDIEIISKSFSSLTITKRKIHNIPSKYIDNIDKIKKIQKWFRGCIFRLKQLPLIMYKIKAYLESQNFQVSIQNEDGRINSCYDEKEVVQLLVKKFGKKIKTPKIRMWYDILAFDYTYGWIPINIKTTTTTTSDNTGNLAMCVYAYTNEVLDLFSNKSYGNGKMANILFNALNSGKYNTNNKKDYYFIVLNKKDTKDVIVNSVKGLTILTPNINNLPFQVCWNKNRVFKYGAIKNKVKLFIDCLKRPKPSWKETFMTNIRTLDV